MRGPKVDLDAVERFRAEYLYTGNATKSAKRVGIAERTGRDLAKKLCEDASFAADRQKLRTRHLDETERSVMTVTRKAEERFLAKMLPALGNGPVVDKRPEYGKLIIDAHRTIVARERLDADRVAGMPGEKQAAPVINVVLSGEHATQAVAQAQSSGQEAQTDN